MTRTEIPELLACFEDGTYAEADVLFLLAKLTATEDVDAILEALPEGWRRRFATWIIGSYDNDERASDFMMLDSAVGEVSEKAVIIKRIRAWIATRKRSARGQ